MIRFPAFRAAMYGAAKFLLAVVVFVAFAIVLGADWI